MSLFPSDRYYRSVTTQFFIRGAPDGAESASLYIGPQNDSSLSATLFMAAPPGLAMSLVIGQNTFGSGELTLYSSGFEGGGGISDQSPITLNIGGISNDGVPTTTTVPLFIDGPASVEFNESVDLNIIGGSPIAASGSLSLVVLGDDPTGSNPILESQITSLYIGNFDEHTSNATLHIETDFNYGTTAPLFIKSSFTSGVMPINIEGAEVEADSISLHIKVPVSSGVSLFNRGYLE
jgi:hypothetical protein